MLAVEIFKLFVVLAIFSAATSAQAKPLEWDASPQKIRAAHQDSPKVVWKLTYQTRDGTLLKFTVGSNYVRVDSGSTSTIYDFKLKRQIHLDDSGSKYFHSSLYLVPGFRDYEFQNRIRQSRFFDALKNAPKIDRSKAPTTFDPFWRASDLGHTRGRPDLEEAERTDRDDGGFNVVYQDVTALEFVPARQSLDEHHNAVFYRALRYFLSVHPAAQNLMADTGHPPDTLKFKKWLKFKLHTRSWSLRSIEKQDAEYPLPTAAHPDFQLLLEKSGLSPDFLSKIAPFMSLVKLDKAINRLSHWGDYREQISNLLENGDRFDAGLLAMEYVIRFRPCKFRTRPVRK
ncbi:MAG: hypothetical protein O3A84_05320 [Proteobacteria bacterium]|nr:hypothetical protein [Pseudomonadota bacterium]